MSETMLNQHRQASPLISTDQFISFFSPDHSNPNSNLVQLMSNSSSMAAFLPAASNHHHHHDLLIPNLADHHHHHPALFTTLLQQPTTLADEDDEEDEDEDDDDDEDDCDYDYISDRNLNCLNGQSFNLPRRSSTNPILGKELSNYMSSSSDHLIMVPATETQEYQWELRSGVKRQYHLEEWKKTNDDVRYDCNDREDVENPNNTVLDKRDNKNTTQKKKTKKNGSADIRRGVQMKSYKTTKAGGRRKVREPRFCFKTLSDVDVLDDGYKWRKYGQKVVKNTQHPRSYYRCTQDNCRVKKRVERLAEDPRMVITTYEGRHVHSPSHDNDDEDNPNNISNSTIPFLSNFFG